MCQRQISVCACIFIAATYFTLIKSSYSFFFGGGAILRDLTAHILAWLLFYSNKKVFEEDNCDMQGLTHILTKVVGCDDTRRSHPSSSHVISKSLRISLEVFMCISILPHISILILSFISVCLRLSSELWCLASGTT